MISVCGLHNQLAAQALASKNFRDWYNPEGEIFADLQLVRNGERLDLYYLIQSRENPITGYSIKWEKRDSFTQRDGIPFSAQDSVSTSKEKSIQGNWSFDLPAKPWLIVLQITNKETQQSWQYFKLLEAHYPYRGWVEQQGQRYTKKYFTLNQSYVIKSSDSDNFYVSYFNEDFPAAYPPFSEKIEKADRFIFHDSTFIVKPGSEISFTKPGLYLFQKDTTAAEGFGVRSVSRTFPKFSSIADLKKPLIYICTQDEYLQLENAKDDKSKFDKVIIDITQDKDRASNFMKGYYRRVELANLYFSSYKEGWKTDRGMIYLIFGLPDEVSVNDGSENWYYKNSKTRFTFVKSGSVYDPDNYVLLRDKKFTTIWFSTIDLWRKSRF